MSGVVGRILDFFRIIEEVLVLRSRRDIGVPSLRDVDVPNWKDISRGVCVVGQKNNF